MEKYVRRRTCCTGYYTECIIDDNIQVDNIFKDDTNTGNYTSVIDNSNTVLFLKQMMDRQQTRFRPLTITRHRY